MNIVMIIVYLAILLLAGLLLKVSIIFAPLVYAITVLTVKNFKKNCEACNTSIGFNRSAKNNSEHKNMH